VGIGIGIGIGALVLVTISVICFTARQRNRHGLDKEFTYPKKQSPPYVIVNPVAQYSELSGTPARLELGAER
jgi:hypothetical protein